MAPFECWAIGNNAAVDARLNWWAKEVAPSTELRKWFGHDSERWEEFRRNYRDELAQVPETLLKLLDYCQRRTNDPTRMPPPSVTAIIFWKKQSVLIFTIKLKHRADSGRNPLTRPVSSLSGTPRAHHAIRL